MTTHPVQINRSRELTGWINSEVTLAAYEVYVALYGEQRSIVTGDCRGGFGTLELIAFLYAKSFPRSEWRARVDEALDGARGL